jgi:hypothetical protein
MVRTFVDVTMYPQYNNDMIIKRGKKRWGLAGGSRSVGVPGPSCLALGFLATMK